MRTENTDRRETGGLRPFALAVTAVLLAAGCASSSNGYHRHLMKGRVVDASGGEVVLCIGASDGAKVGQEAPVYRLKGGRGSRSPVFERIAEGRVRIVEVFDEHFARAVVIEGSAREHWLVELGPTFRGRGAG